MVYDQGICRCEYRQNSKFNTSVAIDGRLINPETISDLNCSQGELGVIPIPNLPTIGNLSEVRVSITAVNRYGESSATVYNGNAAMTFMYFITTLKKFFYGNS